MPARPAPPPRIAAILLAGLLTAAWAFGDRANLAALILPDTDDVMRLQAVRDLIGGQAFGDPVQHRLADGVAMHWSRLPDLPLAAIILGVRPLVDAHWAEVAAVVLWPALGFALMIGLLADIAGRMRAGAGWPALILAALAFPATTLFAPGRIDHHGLQLLLVLGQIAALVRPPTLAAGLVAGAAAAAGAVIGLESAPLALVAGMIASLRGGVTMRGFGLGLAGGLALLSPLAGTGATCDTVAPLLPALVAGGAAMALASAMGRGRFAVLAVAGVTIGALWHARLAPCAAGPYGAVDPILARLWLANVQEARPLFALPALDVLRYAGLLFAGVAASLWCVRAWGGGWWTVLAFQLTALAVTLVQLRGDYPGAALAVLPMAALLADARAGGRALRGLALWLGGAGLVYPLAATALAPAPPRADDAAGCSIRGMIAALSRLPPGRVMTPIDLGAYAIAATPHTAVSAPYHRNNAGNLAGYRFYLASPAVAAQVAGAWRVDYAVTCPDPIGGVTPAPGTIGAGAVPPWLRPVARVGGVSVHAVDPRLWRRGSPR